MDMNVHDHAPVVTLATLGMEPVWVAWQKQLVKNGKSTKVPHNANPGIHGRASSTDRATWTTRDLAEKRAAKLPKPFGLGGVALIFSDLGDGTSTGGIDLDTCRNPESGDIEPWAADIIEKFRSYAEVSPSNTGVKIFFRYRTNDLDNLRTAMGGGKFGTVWKRPGKDHPPGIELYLAKRFFAVTD